MVVSIMNPSPHYNRGIRSSCFYAKFELCTSLNWLWRKEHFYPVKKSESLSEENISMLMRSYCFRLEAEAIRRSVSVPSRSLINKEKFFKSSLKRISRLVQLEGPTEHKRGAFPFINCHSVIWTNRKTRSETWTNQLKISSIRS